MTVRNQERNHPLLIHLKLYTHPENRLPAFFFHRNAALPEALIAGRS